MSEMLPPQKIGSVYFQHPTNIGEDGKKETVFPGSVFQNRFDADDPRKELSLTQRVGDTFVRARGIIYGPVTDEQLRDIQEILDAGAYVLNIPEKAYLKVKIGTDKPKKKADGNTPPNPDKF